MCNVRLNNETYCTARSEFLTQKGEKSDDTSMSVPQVYIQMQKCASS